MIKITLKKYNTNKIRKRKLQNREKIKLIDYKKKNKNFKNEFYENDNFCCYYRKIKYPKIM